MSSFSGLVSASLAVFALGPVLGACSSSPGSTATDSPTSASITDGVFDAGATCNQQEAQVRAILDPLLDAATADPSCMTDDDCLFVENGTACTPGCGVLPSYTEDISAGVAAGADANDFLTLYQLVQRYE